MAGLDNDFQGEARPQKRLKVGYLPQEPSFNESKTVKEIVEEAVHEIKKRKCLKRPKHCVSFKLEYFHLLLCGGTVHELDFQAEDEKSTIYEKKILFWRLGSLYMEILKIDGFERAIARR